MNYQPYIKNLPVFDFIRQLPVANNTFEEVALVCVQHEMSATINMLETLNQFGLPYSSIFLLGKFYSGCDFVRDILDKKGINRLKFSKTLLPGQFSVYFEQEIQKLWAMFMASPCFKKLSKLIVLDDGGRLISSIPKEVKGKFQIVCIEQTTAGVRHIEKNQHPFPIINVARSAAKVYLEPSIIANASITKTVEKVIFQKSTAVYGVVGLGAIGKGIVDKLNSYSCAVLGHDKSSQAQLSSQNCCSLETLLRKSEVIFGCTGFDISTESDIDDFEMDKIFLSVSSEDTEFKHLLQQAYTRSGLNEKPIFYEDALKNLTYQNAKGASITFYRGGYPISFDGTGQPTSIEELQFIQSMLLGSLLQAYGLFHEGPATENNLIFSPKIQHHVSKEWLRAIGKSPLHYLKKSSDYQLYSEGLSIKNTFIRNLFKD